MARNIFKTLFLGAMMYTISACGGSDDGSIYGNGDNDDINGGNGKNDNSVIVDNDSDYNNDSSNNDGEQNDGETIDDIINDNDSDDNNFPDGEYPDGEYPDDIDDDIFPDNDYEPGTPEYYNCDVDNPSSTPGNCKELCDNVRHWDFDELCSQFYPASDFKVFPAFDVTRFKLTFDYISSKTSIKDLEEILIYRDGKLFNRKDFPESMFVLADTNSSEDRDGRIYISRFGEPRDGVTQQKEHTFCIKKLYEHQDKDNCFEVNRDNFPSFYVGVFQDICSASENNPHIVACAPPQDGRRYVYIPLKEPIEALRHYPLRNYHFLFEEGFNTIQNNNLIIACVDEYDITIGPNDDLRNSFIFNGIEEHDKLYQPFVYRLEGTGTIFYDEEIPLLYESPNCNKTNRTDCNIDSTCTFVEIRKRN